MPSLPPLHWDFCINCNRTLSEKEIDDDDSFCYYCMEELDDGEREWVSSHSNYAEYKWEQLTLWED